MTDKLSLAVTLGAVVVASAAVIFGGGQFQERRQLEKKLVEAETWLSTYKTLTTVHQANFEAAELSLKARAALVNSCIYLNNGPLKQCLLESKLNVYDSPATKRLMEEGKKKP